MEQILYEFGYFFILREKNNFADVETLFADVYVPLSLVEIFASGAFEKSLFYC